VKYWGGTDSDHIL